MFELNVSFLLYANGVMGAAALIGTLTGFGYALLATPMLILVMPPREVVPLVLLSSVVLLMLLAVESHREMDGRKISRWVLGALPGMFVGGYVLATVSDGTMKSVIGVITLCAAALLSLRPGRPWQREWPGALGAGLFSGVLVGASGMSGPPVILFGLKQNWNHRVLRASLIGYFSIIHALAVLVLGRIGVGGTENLFQLLSVLPGVIVGFILGMKWRSRVNQTLFRTIAFGLLCASGALALFGI